MRSSFIMQSFKDLVERIHKTYAYNFPHLTSSLPCVELTANTGWGTVVYSIRIRDWNHGVDVTGTDPDSVTQELIRRVDYALANPPEDQPTIRATETPQLDVN